MSGKEDNLFIDSQLLLVSTSPVLQCWLGPSGPHGERRRTSTLHILKLTTAKLSLGPSDDLPLE